MDVSGVKCAWLLITLSLAFKMSERAVGGDTGVGVWRHLLGEGGGEEGSDTQEEGRALHHGSTSR